MNMDKNGDGDFDDDEEDLTKTAADDVDVAQGMHVTEEDLRKEDEEIRELEKKKVSLFDLIIALFAAFREL